jgi:regulator of protease activity HflC (stomatin/prohibitin superfamily)
MFILKVVLAILVVLFLFDGWFIVLQKHKGLVTRLGKYIGKPADAGFKLKLPLIDKVWRVSTALQQIPANLATKTKDDQFVTLPISIQFLVANGERYIFDSTDPNQQIKDIITAEVRKYTSKKDFQELYDERQEISESVKQSVQIELEDYGVSIIRIVIDEPQPDEGTKEAYNDVKASERRKEAASNDAQAAYIMTVKAAEADAKRNELIGEGVKSFRKSIAESYIETRAALIGAQIDEDSADGFMMEAMRLDTMRDVGESGNLIVMAMDQGENNNNVLPQIMAALKLNNKNLEANDVEDEYYEDEDDYDEYVEDIEEVEILDDDTGV